MKVQEDCYTRLGMVVGYCSGGGGCKEMGSGSRWWKSHNFNSVNEDSFFYTRKLALQQQQLLRIYQARIKCYFLCLPLVLTLVDDVEPYQMIRLF